MNLQYKFRELYLPQTLQFALVKLSIAQSAHQCYILTSFPPELFQLFLAELESKHI